MIPGLGYLFKIRYFSPTVQSDDCNFIDMQIYASSERVELNFSIYSRILSYFIRVIA